MAESDLAIRLVLDGRDVERKTAALQAQTGQTAELIAAIGLGQFARWGSTECFRVDPRRSCDRDEMSEGPDPVVIDHRMRSPGNAVQALLSNAMAP